AEAWWLDEQPGESSEAPIRVAALDSLARFLRVAGWPVAARRARAARHDLLSADEAVAERGRGRAAALGRSVRRSRSLRWSVRGIGTATDGSDVAERVLRWCGSATGSDAGSAVVGLGDLSGLVEGQELAAVRLIVASGDIEAAAAHVPHHGLRHARWD